MLKARFEYHNFEFKRPSGTSRGVLTAKESWFVYLHDPQKPEVTGIGECSVIPGLSPDYISRLEYEVYLESILKKFENCSSLDDIYHLENIDSFPSILFGLETAFLDWQNGGKGIYFQNNFHTGQQKIPINGLIWMGSKEFLLEQINQKLNEGFTTIKMKIGAMDIETELEVLRYIRSNYSENEITLRVDANGAFSYPKVKTVLRELKNLKIHSIEQPIKAGLIEHMADLCSENIVPIALDEELIGITCYGEKETLLTKIHPQYIILKPSLHGGLKGSREWIEIAERLNIQWWLTSALESNVGLNAICQFCAEFDNPLPQGLGTGSLYINNVPSDLVVDRGTIFSKIN